MCQLHPSLRRAVCPELYIPGSTFDGHTGRKNRIAPGSQQFKLTANQFLRETETLWVGERAAQATFGGVINIPFKLKIPEDAPPSFGFESYMNNAHVRYAVEVVGVKSITDAISRKAKFPVVVVPIDPISNGTRMQLKLGWSHTWGRLKVEDKVRKYPWGEYAHVRMEV